ncbi:hypothetical protein NA56DRAFT_705491 [Hyaloscypha hepaticicola]|uniref:Uncharacterized protein n=1 Tax=Hyaloscypha hepaticicola TaxID=2082293 RepID=A0A2J6Q0G0_9HELO|nr:hypothetical protein NA56DRAFT_705491 [Hyaloscypha hepaticicola]
MNETDLHSQLTFSRKRMRKTPNAGNQAEFYMTDHSGLYLKVKHTLHTSLGTLNQNLLINLGTEYNQELRASTPYSWWASESLILMVCRYLCSLNSQRSSDTAPRRSQRSF